jgi:hypothetical protein
MVAHFKHYERCQPSTRLVNMAARRRRTRMEEDVELDDGEYDAEVYITHRQIRIVRHC